MRGLTQAGGIATYLGRYMIWVNLAPPRRHQVPGLGANTRNAPPAGMANGVEVAARPGGGELSVAIARQDTREGMVFFRFFPRGLLGMPEATVSAGLPAGGVGATSFWTILGMSDRLAAKMEGRSHREILYYHVEGRWVPAVQVRASGRPKGMVLVWRAKRYDFDPRVGYWLASKDGLSQRGRSRGNK